jgi:uncharacterized protein (TIGR00255 family)
MLKSMTGFGVAASETERVEINVEVKSLNSKFLDASLRLPKEYSDKDIEVRNLLSGTLERGKVSFSIDLIEKGEAISKISINKTLVKKYFEELLEASQHAGAADTDLFKLALQMPRAIDTSNNKEDLDKEWNDILKVVKIAISKCESFRLSEGKLLEEKFKGYISKIESLLKKIELQDTARTIYIKEKIRNALHEFSLKEEIDENRFEQELIYYIEKLDISEEKVRLKSHLDYFLENLVSEESNGKKLSFIAQEIGREINTIGSKANDAIIQHFVVEMKEELEKIKEQVLNIL